MDPKDDLDRKRREDFILVSASLYTRPPVDRITANCSRVMRHAMIAAGLWTEDQSAAFHGDEPAAFPIVTLWYSTLIAMTQVEPESDRLLAGGGNLVEPAGAHFTACWVTPAGLQIAEQLLVENPNWRIAMARFG